MRRATLFTPAHARDLERFLLQRESIERCGVAIPHVVVVDHEDLPRFRDLPFQRNLTLVSTRDVLSQASEARRRGYRLRRRQWEWWRCRRFGKPVHGWGIQQIIKLAAPRAVTSEGIVCMDSDTFFVRNVDGSEFFAADGKLHLYETTQDVDVEMAEWVGRAMRFLGVSPTGQVIRRYTHSPVPMHREVLADLHKHIERVHKYDSEAAILRSEMVMEYSTYGVFARHVDGLTRTSPVEPRLSCYFWWPDEVARLEVDFAEKVRSLGAAIVGVQSNTGCSVGRIRELASGLWPRMASASVTVEAS